MKFASNHMRKNDYAHPVIKYFASDFLISGLCAVRINDGGDGDDRTRTPRTGSLAPRSPSEAERERHTQWAPLEAPSHSPGPLPRSVQHRQARRIVAPPGRLAAAEEDTFE